MIINAAPKRAAAGLSMLTPLTLRIDIREYVNRKISKANSVAVCIW